MKTFARAVISGFAFTLGATLFRKISKKLGLEDEPAKSPNAAAAAGETVTHPNADQRPS